MIIGILSALAAPSFLGMVNRAKVNDAVAKVRGALQEAQREAMRKSKKCTVYIPDGAQTQIISDCFVAADGTSTGLAGIPNGLPIKKIDKIAIVSNLSSTPKKITFSFRGNTTTGGTIVLYLADFPTLNKKCVFISNGIGVMRTGNYTGSTSSTITDSNCTASK